MISIEIMFIERQLNAMVISWCNVIVGSIKYQAFQTFFPLRVVMFALENM